jgi:hypothetical protein
MSFHVPEKSRVLSGRYGSAKTDGSNGFFRVYCGRQFNVIASDGGGWEHVSVSLENRTPTWAEMCAIKNVFWDEEDCVVQFHPAKSDYVNNHSYCLHLWRPTAAVLPKPESWMVGIK